MPFVALLQPGCIVCLARCLPTPGHAPDTIRLGMFFLAEPVAFPGQRIKFAGGLLLLCTAHQACCLTELIGCPARGLATLLLAGALLHGFIRVAETVECLGHAGISRIAGAPGGGLGA